MDNMFESEKVDLPVDFAKPVMKEVVSQSTKGKNGNSGLQVKALITKITDSKQIEMQFEMTNHTDT